MEELRDLIAVSHHCGADTDWVIGGGGNTSLKSDDHMWVKASGTTLAAIEPGQFVRMERAKLDAIWRARYPEDPAAREQRALDDLLAARADPDTTLRPSVETLMHALLPNRLVVHTHPTLLNGLTCARDGAAAAAELFGDRAVWIPTIEPGYTLAREIARRVDRWREHHDGTWPRALIMQNHGITVAADGVAAVHALHEALVTAVRARIEHEPDITPLATPRGIADHAVTVARAVAGVTGADPATLSQRSFVNAELAERCASAEAFAPIDCALTPDHIVYSGHRPCYVAAPAGRHDWARAIDHAIGAYHAAARAAPKIVVLQGLGAIAVAPGRRKAELAQLLFLDGLKIAGYARAFGGVRGMPPEQVDFIRNWEVEAFRERRSTACNG